MKLRFEKDILAYATATTQSVANPQSSLPILASILITAQGGGVTFEASDMESCVRCSVQADVLDGGAMTLPAKTFHSIVRELPAGAVELETTDSVAVITSDSNQYKLTTQTSDDFPSWPDLQATTTISIDQATFNRILNHVTFALPQRDPRKVLLGALFDIKNNELICVATDGKKLGLSRCDLPDVAGVQPTSAIIPQKILNEVHRNLSNEGVVRLLIGERQVAFEMGNLVYLSNRIDGTFPNYEMVIPREFTREIRFARQTFLNAIRRASIISEERTNSIIMRFEPGRVQFTARTYEVGSYTGSLDVDYDGDAFDIAFNHVYLLEAFRAIESETVIMKVKQNTAPVVFLNPEEEKSIFLVMPIKLTDISEFGS
jgi:DNA polymerase-3 subunit beta